MRWILSNDQVNMLETLDFVSHVVYTTALFVCRLSGLAFYSRIGERHSTLSRIIYVATAFLCLAFMTQVVLLIVHCLPITGTWPYYWQPELYDYKCLGWGAVYVSNSGLSLVCDLVIFFIPAAIIVMVRRTTVGKFKLSLVLFPGIL